ncbi:MAG TPA: DUF3341 domain-containing protein [Vicinamibacterales bacterium]|nr:DUF3341 domain-containing protein [Vicinamibacterales bacterium]
MATASVYGLLAEFDTPAELVTATKRVHAEGYRNIDTFSPFPVEEAWEAMHHHDKRLSLIVLLGGITGMFSGYGLEYWVHTMAYPVNVAGKPLNSWPQFIPVTFEMTVLFAAISALLGMIVLNGLPMPYHPVFNVERFARASQDKFFLLIESTDPKFDRSGTLELLKGLNPSEINEVEP